MDSIYIWNAITLNGEPGYGTIRNQTKKSVCRQLHHLGYYQVRVETVPHDQLNSPLKNVDLIYFLDALVSILDAGISIAEALDLLINDRRSAITRYVFLELKTSLHEGQNLEEAFTELSPLFSEFFVAMIRLCEKSGRLRQGLHDLKSYYQHQENRRRELVRIFRYPKIVSTTILLLTFGVVVFIVPMFNNVYALFKGDLPILTRIIVGISRFVHENDLLLLAGCMTFFVWGMIPMGRAIHPWFLLSRKLNNVTRSREDPFIYAHAMALLLDSGQSVDQAAQQAMQCMSGRNQKQGQFIVERLSSGMGFAESFQGLDWFPDPFHQFLKPAEQTGLLKMGFEQIYTYIDRQRSARFEKWSRFIEPVLMLILGTITLVLLLSIYLPVFDLGNRIG